MKMQLQKVRSSAVIPEYQTEGAVGCDLHACLEERVVIPPLKRAVVPTGIAVAIPTGFEGTIRMRSGLSAKYGFFCVNGVGTIDSDYRGELGVIVGNMNVSKPIYIDNEDRIAQLVISPVTIAELSVVDNLPSTARGTGGFGSTGVGENDDSVQGVQCDEVEGESISRGEGAGLVEPE